MTLRDYFAASALGAVILHTQEAVTEGGGETLCFSNKEADEGDAELVAYYSYAVADAMLKVRDPSYPQPEATEVAVDAAQREDFAWMVVQEACETEPADEDDPECIRILRRDLKSAVLAAYIRNDAAMAAQQGGA